MNIVTRKLFDLRPDPLNPRHNTEAVPGVIASIKQFGYKVPIVIDETNTIKAGHTRWEALKQIHAETGEFAEFQCILADDLNEEQLKGFMIADNLVAQKATWDFQALEIILTDLPNFQLEEFGEIKGFRDIIVAPEVLDEPEIREKKTVIKVGEETYEWDQAHYHSWAGYILDRYSMSPMDFIITRLEINETDRSAVVEEIDI